MNNSLSQGDIDIEISKTDSLTQLLGELNGKNKFPILLRLAEETRNNNPDLAASFMDQAKEWIDENEISEDLFLYFKYLSSVKLSQDLYRESISMAEKAELIILQSTDPLENIELFQTMGQAKSILGENDKAQQFLFKALKIADSLQIHYKVAQIFNGIGNVYRAINDLEMTEKYWLLAKEKAKEIEAENIYTYVLGNLAIFYCEIKRYDEAEKICLESLDKAEEIGDKYYLATIYNTLAVIYADQNQYDAAIEYYKKALVFAEEVNDASLIGLIHCNFGEAYTSMNSFKIAKQHLDIGLKITKTLEYKNDYEYALLKTIELYEKNGKHEEALEYFKQYSSLKDSLLNENRIQVVAELEEKYQAEQKELEIVSLSRENIKTQNALKLLRYLIFGLCFGVLGFVAFIYIIRQNHKKNVIIQNKNLKIASDKIEILEKRKEITKLSSLIKGQEYERERLAKEMHDGLGGLLAISHSKLGNLITKNEVNIATIEESKKLVGEAYNQVRQISHNLMPLELEKFGLVTTLKNMISLVNNQNNDINLDFRTYNFEITLNNELGLNIYRIVQEAITNILKYAQANNVLIELIQHEQHLSLNIEDDGVGLDLMNFKSGIGIQNMRNRAELFSGSFELESNLGVGTSISVQIPLPIRSITQSRI